MKTETTAVQHTPGPWRIELVGEFGNLSQRVMGNGEPQEGIPHGGNFVATVARSIGRGAANARLIAAAPDGLAIAQRWMAWAMGPVVPIAIRIQLQADTEAFIAKATGATP